MFNCKNTVRLLTMSFCFYVACTATSQAASNDWGLDDSERWDFSRGVGGLYEQPLFPDQNEQQENLEEVIPEEIRNERQVKAKGKSKEKEQPQEEMPVTIFADYIHYDNLNGDIFAEGNVKVIQNSQVILAARIDGNIKTGDIWTKTLTRFVDPVNRSDFTGDSSEYNYNYKTGHIYNVTGKSGTEFITSDNVEIQPDKLVGLNASMSRCNAQKHAKCQHTTATRVDIWPNDRLIAYNADVYILGTKVYSQARYVTTLTGGKRQIPRIGYDDDDGFYIKHRLAFPLGTKTVAGADLYAGTKIGGKSKGWLRHDETNFDATYSYGYFEDSDNEWIKKEHNLKINYKAKQLFRTPLYYSFWFERGRWTDEYKTSWHSEAGAYLSHAPIYLGSKSLYMTLGTGYRKLKESYMDISQDEYRYDIGLNKNFRKWRFSTMYSNVKNHVDIFDYNNINVSESLQTTISWVPDRLNAFVYFREYDLANSRLYKHRLTYIRNLHCWQIILSYERERFLYKDYENKFRWEIHLAI